MAEPTCHYCNRPAEEECPACGRLYCGEHGEDVCIRCMSPEAAIPSATVFRGSLVVLVIASIVALFLWISPPRSSGSNAVIGTATAPFDTTGATATPTPSSVPSASASASANATQPAGTTPASSATAAGTPKATATGHAYTIVEGDNLESIAAAHNVTVAQIQSLNPTLNPNLIPGTVLNLP